MLVDDDGVIVPLGEDGELWCKCPAMMTRYRGDDAQTNKVFSSDGFIKNWVSIADWLNNLAGTLIS